MDGHGRRLQILGALVLVLGSLGVAAALAARGPEVAYLAASPDAPWIMAPHKVNSNLQQWGRPLAPRVRFVRRFELAEIPQEAELHVRGLRHFSATLNGSALPPPPDDNADWRRGLQAEVASALRVGSNELAVEVTHRYGPSLLSLRLAGVLKPIHSGEGFRVFIDGKPAGPAVPADDTQREMATHLVESPLEGLRSRGAALLGLFVGLSLVASLGFRALPPTLAARMPQLILSMVGMAWVWLFATKIARIPLEYGFDARHHLQYIDWIATKGSVPLATDGWSTFHPPLFYALAALLRGGGNEVLRAIPWFAGLASVGVVAAIARRLHPDRPAIAAWAIVFAAALPVHLYSATYLTNETLHTLLTSLALLFSFRALEEQETQRTTLLALGAFLGLAALTKFTVIALAPVMLFFLALKLWRIEGNSLPTAAARLAIPVAVALLVCGGYYARNVWYLGTPIQGNWGHLPGVQAWWQQPGFHTFAYYTGFGEVLRHGYFAGFVSLWDGTYSTFWGDGLLGGLGTPAYRHAFWNYGFMSGGFLLALPLTAVLGLGGVLTLRQAFSATTASRRAIHCLELTAIYALVYSFATLTLSLPFFSQAKASYLLPLLVPLSLVFARGVEALEGWAARGNWLARGVLTGALGTCLACLWLGFAG